MKNQPEQNQPEQNQLEQQVPVLRPGTSLIQLVNGDYYVGSPRKGFCFTEIQRYRFLQSCDGKKTLSEIAQLIGCESNSLIAFLESAISNNYLLLLSDQITSGEKTRRDCESNFYISHLDSHNFATASAVLFRQRAQHEILIFGSNQFSVALFAILQAAGFSKSRIIGSFGFDASQIIAEDLAGGVIQSSDIGSTLNQISKRISREHQLVNTAGSEIYGKNQPALIIAMQPIPVDYQQRWLSESTPYLVIGPVIENQVDIGPIVLPGASTCLRCIDLSATANALTPEIATLNYLSAQERIPAGVLSILIGYTQLFVAQFLDPVLSGISHPLISSALRIDLDNPCKQSHIKWQPNSMCGCGADLGEYAGGQFR